VNSIENRIVTFNSSNNIDNNMRNEEFSTSFDRIRINNTTIMEIEKT
jgi:hypothetical protein